MNEVIKLKFAGNECLTTTDSIKLETFDVEFTLSKDEENLYIILSKDKKIYAIASVYTDFEVLP